MIYVVLGAAAAAVLVVLLVRRNFGPDVQGEVERFRSVRAMTTDWSRQSAGRPGVTPAPPEHGPESAEPPPG